MKSTSFGSPLKCMCSQLNRVARCLSKQNKTKQNNRVERYPNFVVIIKNILQYIHKNRVKDKVLNKY
jgi:hypothetical protein